MTTDLASLLDKYSLKARVYPALLAALPLVVSITLLWVHKPIDALLPAGASLGVIYLLANIVRSRGQTIEKRLILKWDGLPTTSMLRYRSVENTVLVERYRSQLEKLLSITLPTRRQERQQPDRADEHYVAATRSLITRVRAKSRDFPLVQEENIQYGFRRNLLGLKPVAIGVIALSACADAIYLAIVGIDGRLIAAVAVGIGMLTVWLAIVRPEWVHQAGRSYAERLFETLESGQLFPDSENQS